MHPVLICTAHWIHYTGTVGHAGYWRLVFFCEKAPPGIIRAAAALLGH